MKKIQIADKDIAGGYVCHPFSHGGEFFKRSRCLSSDEVLAIPAPQRRMRVEIGDLKIFKRPRQQRHADVSAAPVMEKPPPWNWKAPTEREKDAMKAWVKKVLDVRDEPQLAAEERSLYSWCKLFVSLEPPPAKRETMREAHARTIPPERREAIRKAGLPFPVPMSQAQRELLCKMQLPDAMNRWRYGDSKLLRKLLLEIAPVLRDLAESLPSRLPLKQGQTPPQQERNIRNVRKLWAVKDVNHIREVFRQHNVGRWPDSIVVEVVAAHRDLDVKEVKTAVDRGVKELEKALRLTK
jgi:hypothetical protein